MCAAVTMPGDITSQSSSPPAAGSRVTFDNLCLARSASGAGARKPPTLNIDTSLACGKGGGPHNHPPFPRTPPPWLAKRRLTIPSSSSPMRRRPRDKGAQADGGPRGSRSARIRSSVSAAFRWPSASHGHGGGGRREKKEDEGPRRPLGCGEEERRAGDKDYVTANLSLQSTASSAATADSTDMTAQFIDAAQPRPGRPTWRRRWWS
ncbi:hypothetical protein RB601_002884 [Gaeumannomyces tritici]